MTPFLAKQKLHTRANAKAPIPPTASISPYAVTEGSYYKSQDKEILNPFQ